MTIEQALSIAYAQLNRRERTVHEIRAALVRRGAEPEVVESAVLELVDQGYLDDARFAQLFVQDKRVLEQWGSARIRRALLDRGVSAELVDAALGDGSDSSDELDQALNLLQRRFPAPLVDRRGRERALGVLLRKGYEYELAVNALAAHRHQAGTASE